MAHLTNAERDTLNAAMEIILAHTPQGASWQIYAHWYKATPQGHGITYFDSAGGQHGSLAGPAFADRVERAIAAESRAVRDEDFLRRLKVERLRKELATLTGETA